MKKSNDSLLVEGKIIERMSCLMCTNSVFKSTAVVWLQALYIYSGAGRSSVGKFALCSSPGRVKTKVVSMDDPFKNKNGNTTITNLYITCKYIQCRN